MISNMLIHSFTSIITSMGRRGKQEIEAKTGCGEKLYLDYARDESLLDIGLSGWSNQVTCPPCIERNRAKD